jgi:oligoribonuclease (3'-5' exoribonuclease)
MSELPKHTLWLDIETDGHPVEQGTMLEFACILTETGHDFVEIDRYESLIDPGFTPVSLLRENAPEVVREMHDKNGLWHDLREAQKHERVRSCDDVDWQVNAMLNRAGCTSTHIACAGSGVAHYDRPWLAYFMPKLAKRFAYWSFDIGAVRRFVKVAGLEVAAEALGYDVGHRAMSDTNTFLEQGRLLCAALRLGSVLIQKGNPDMPFYYL